MIEIEFEKPNYTTCECCGNQVTWLTRFVYKDNEAIAFYYATFTEHAEEKEVKCLVGICEWENPESEEYTKVTGFPMVLWVDKNQQANVSLLDKNEVPWENILKGEILDREEALNHPYKEEVCFCDGPVLFLILQLHHSKSQYASNDPCFPLVLQISEGEPINLLESSIV
ncbi:MAG: hypothetical protein ACFN00_03735 [Flavobacteriaceae bacterium]